MQCKNHQLPCWRPPFLPEDRKVLNRAGPTVSGLIFYHQVLPESSSLWIPPSCLWGAGPAAGDFFDARGISNICIAVLRLLSTNLSSTFSGCLENASAQGVQTRGLPKELAWCARGVASSKVVWQNPYCPSATPSTELQQGTGKKRERVRTRISLHRFQPAWRIGRGRRLHPTVDRGKPWRAPVLLPPPAVLPPSTTGPPETSSGPDSKYYCH